MTTKYFNLDWRTSLLRFYLLMAIVIFAAFTNMFAIAFLALPVFLSIMLGFTIEFKKEAGKDARMVNLENSKVTKKAI